VGGAGGLEGKLSGECTGHQERGPDCPQQHVIRIRLQ
jgi:hypothetical protein